MKWLIVGVPASIVVAFSLGALVGWKTTLKVIDSVYARKIKHASE